MFCYPHGSTLGAVDEQPKIGRFFVPLKLIMHVCDAVSTESIDGIPEKAKKGGNFDRLGVDDDNGIVLSN